MGLQRRTVWGAGVTHERAPTGVGRPQHQFSTLEEL